MYIGIKTISHHNRAAFEYAVSINDGKNILIEETKDLQAKEKKQVLEIFADCNKQTSLEKKVTKKPIGKTPHWSELIE